MTGTHPGRLTEIITGMTPAFAGPRRPREQQVSEAVALVLATSPTPAELADAREEVLERKQSLIDGGVPGALRDRAAMAEALAIAEQRVSEPD